MSAALAGQGVNLRRNRANLRDDAATGDADRSRRRTPHTCPLRAREEKTAERRGVRGGVHTTSACNLIDAWTHKDDAAANTPPKNAVHFGDQI